jgi:hypothetical protein
MHWMKSSDALYGVPVDDARRVLPGQKNGFPSWVRTGKRVPIGASPSDKGWPRWRRRLVHGEMLAEMKAPMRTSRFMQWLRTPKASLPAMACTIVIMVFLYGVRAKGKRSESIPTGDGWTSIVYARSPELTPFFSPALLLSYVGDDVHSFHRELAWDLVSAALIASALAFLLLLCAPFDEQLSRTVIT